MIRPQAYGAIFINGKTCAFGAALEAAGVQFPLGAIYDYDQALWRLYDTHQWPLTLRVTCPACTGNSVSLGWLVTHLNDRHQWTRERIAAFIDTVDPPPQSTPAPAETVHA
jgi:hypothetical protein